MSHAPAAYHHRMIVANRYTVASALGSATPASYPMKVAEVLTPTHPATPAGASPDPTGPPFRVRRFGAVGSTNDLARAAAEAGEPEGTWFVAEAQTAGRGRHGRGWTSPPGNFYGSLLLRPDTSLAGAASLSLVAGLAVAEAIHALSDGRLAPRVKWPNDVLLGSAKLAGILLEGAARAGGSTASWVIVGLGVNLASHPADAPYPVTALATAGLPGITPDAFLDALLRPFGARLVLWRERGFAALRDAWLAAAAGLGSPVRLRLGGDAVEGRLVDVDETGAVRLALIDGTTRRFEAGELFFG